MAEYQIKNWKRFQHYNHRCPPWIKLHIEIFTSSDWVMLDDASRLLAIVCMLIASRHDGKIPASCSPAYFKRIAYLDKLPNFKPLIQSGFLIETLADDSACKRLRTNGDTESESELELESELERIAPRAKARVGAHLIPEDWKPKEKHAQLASQLGLTVEQLESASCEMRDWSKGAGKRRTDWDATFNNWMRRNAQRNYKPNGKHEPPRKYKTYRPPGWTDDDERKLEETNSRHGTGGESLLAASEGISGKERH